METRRFRLWNIASGLPYAIGHVGFGYVLGLGVTQLPPVLMREALVGLALGAAALGLWWSLRRLDRALPVVLEMLGGLMDRIAGMPRADAFGTRHPRLARLIASRMDRSHFLGLPATLLGIGFVYLLGLGAGIAFDFAHSAPIVQIDARLAQLMHALWTPGLVAGFTVFTALGDVRGGGGDDQPNVASTDDRVDAAPLVVSRFQCGVWDVDVRHWGPPRSRRSRTSCTALWSR